MRHYPRECSCGSGKYSDEIYDARGIYITSACEDCERDRLKGYRPEVLTDPDYDCEEQIDPD